MENTNDRSTVKKCSRCGELLPIGSFRIKNTRCRKCEAAYFRDYQKKKSRVVLKDDIEVIVKREYKKIDPQRILDISGVGIPLVGEDEIFVTLTDSKAYFLSNYGRCIRVLPDCKFELMVGQKEGRDRSYTIRKYRYINGTCEEYAECLYVAQAVIAEFIENPDTVRNIYIWHKGMQQNDYYYKHLYPVTQEQYYTLKEYYKQGGDDDEDVILNIMNDFRFASGDWSANYLKRRICGIGYYGCNDVDTNCASYKRWKDMLRLYGEKVCAEWLNYSNFRKWWDEHDYQIGSEKMMLTFRILNPSGEIMCPASAAIVPHSLIAVLPYANGSGVYYDRSKKRWRGAGIGQYRTEEEAKEAKREQIRDMARKYKVFIPYYVYAALMTWKI